MARYGLGIDGGGSKCDAALMEESGAVVGWGEGGPIHVYYHPPEVIERSYSEAIAGALEGVGGADVWAAGVLPAGAPREAILARNRLAGQVKASEVDSGFASAQVEWGLIVLAGTGSFVHGRSPDGREVHFGGMGPVLNDYGSAYDIGLRGLRAAFASGWTEARRTSLAEAIPAALDRADLKGVFRQVYVEGLGRREIASLARVVNREAEAGDRIAIECVQKAAEELAVTAVEAIAELGMGSLELPVVPVGGVARRSRLWWARVGEHLRRAAPRMREVTPMVRPATGAALVALRAMGVPWTPEIVGRARDTEAAAREEAGGNGADGARRGEV